MCVIPFYMSHMGPKRGTDSMKCFDVLSVQYSFSYYVTYSTYKVYIQLQSHFLHVLAVDCHLQGATPIPYLHESSAP